MNAKQFIVTSGLLVLIMAGVFYFLAISGIMQMASLADALPGVCVATDANGQEELQLCK